MAEPQPPTVHEGASEDPSQTDPVPKSGDDRKAAAALSALDSRGGGDDAQGGGHVDAEALGKAMKRLDVKDKAGGAGGKKVKIEAGDVTLLVEQLELSKVKATELLKAHEGDAVKALTAYVMAAV